MCSQNAGNAILETQILKKFFSPIYSPFPHQSLQQAHAVGISTWHSNRPWVVGQSYFVSWHPCGEHLVYDLCERHIGILLPKKVPKRKTCQVLRKRGIFDYLLLNCITAILNYSNFEFNNNKNDLHHEKEHKKTTYKTFKQFFYLSNGFRVIRCQTPIFKLEPSLYCAILVQSSHLKQK